MESGFHSGGHKARAGSTSRDRGPRLFMQVPSGRRVWPYLACQASLINNHNQEAHAHQEKQSGLPDAGLETGAEPIHTCLNRTSHLERSHLLPTVASPSLGWRPLLSPTTLRARPAGHHPSRLVRPGGRLGRSPAPRKQHSRCGRAGRQGLPGICSARRTHHHHSRTLALALAQALACARVWSIKAFAPYRRSGQDSHPPGRPSLPLDSGAHDTDTVLAGSPSFIHLHAPSSVRTFRPGLLSVSRHHHEDLT